MVRGGSVIAIIMSGVFGEGRLIFCKKCVSLFLQANKRERRCDEKSNVALNSAFFCLSDTKTLSKVLFEQAQAY